MPTARFQTGFCLELYSKMRHQAQSLETMLHSYLRRHLTSSSATVGGADMAATANRTLCGDRVWRSTQVLRDSICTITSQAFLPPTILEDRHMRRTSTAHAIGIYVSDACRHDSCDRDSLDWQLRTQQLNLDSWARQICLNSIKASKRHKNFL